MQELTLQLNFLHPSTFTTIHIHQVMFPFTGSLCPVQLHGWLCDVLCSQSPTGFTRAHCSSIVNTVDCELALCMILFCIILFYYFPLVNHHLHIFSITCYERFHDLLLLSITRLFPAYKGSCSRTLNRYSARNSVTQPCLSLQMFLQQKKLLYMDLEDLMLVEFLPRSVWDVWYFLSYIVNLKYSTIAKFCHFYFSVSYSRRYTVLSDSARESRLLWDSRKWSQKLLFSGSQD